MNRVCVFLIVISIFLVSCRYKHTMTESVYSLDDIKILRQDWDGCMTKLTYYFEDSVEIGSALFYYPGRDGWFLIDNVWGENGKIYLVHLDACPKVIINDSTKFINRHDIRIPVKKERWRRMCSCDDAPVVHEQNDEYGTIVEKTAEKTMSVSNRPDYNNYPGLYYDFKNNKLGCPINKPR